LPGKFVYLEDLVSQEGPYCTGPDHLVGAAQPAGRAVLPVARRIYEAVKAKGLGREIPTEWFLQDIRD
jgi:hypothetical protein